MAARPDSTSPLPWQLVPNSSKIGPRNSDRLEDPYNFVPTMGVCATFVALYSISTVLHLGQAVFYRTWFMIPTAGFSGILEILGWSGRLWSSMNVNLETPFLMQISVCILGPSALLAANIEILRTIIHRLGSGYSRVSPRWYSIILGVLDVISLTIQAIGGDVATQAGERHDKVAGQKGANIMLGGIVLHLCVIIAFAGFIIDFFVQYSLERPVRIKSTVFRGPLDKMIRLMIAALIFDVTCLFIRAVFRTIELSDGWDGRIISTELYFNVLDGAMVTLAIFTLNIVHPRILLWPEEGTTRAHESREKPLIS